MILEDKDDVLVEVVFDIIRVANLLDKIGANYAKTGNISSVQQYKILAMLMLKDNVSMSDLRENTLVSKQAVTGIVERLQKNDFVEKATDVNDRRIIRVKLTPKGREALEIAQPFRIRGNREVFSVLSDLEIDQLSAILNKLKSHLKNNSIQYN